MTDDTISDLLEELVKKIMSTATTVEDAADIIKSAIQFPYKSFGPEQLKLIDEIASWRGKERL